MTPIDRTTRMSGLRTALVWAVVMTGAASICGSFFLAWKGLDQAATSVATTGASVTAIGGAWVFVRSREVGLGLPRTAHGGEGPDGDGPDGPSGGGRT